MIIITKSLNLKILLLTLVLIPQIVWSQDKSNHLSQLTFENSVTSNKNVKKEINYFPADKFPVVGKTEKAPESTNSTKLEKKDPASVQKTIVKTKQTPKTASVTPKIEQKITSPESNNSEYNVEELVVNESEEDSEYGKSDFGSLTFGLQPDK